MNTNIDEGTFVNELFNTAKLRLESVLYVPNDDVVWLTEFFAIVTRPCRVGHKAYSVEFWVLHKRRVNGARAALRSDGTLCCRLVGYVIVQQRPLRIWMVASLTEADRETGNIRGDYRGMTPTQAVKRARVIQLYRDYASLTN